MKVLKQISPKILLGSLVATTMIGCVHPMMSAEIDELTTCPKSVDIPKVKKNLLLAGYGITHATDEEIVTDFKQSYGRNWQRITAVKIGDVVKFKVRTRTERVETVPTSTSTTSFVSNSDRRKKEKGTEVVTTQERAERVQNDSDLDYYIEHRNQYENTKHEVCGAGY